MADPRFYDNKGPFALSALCALAVADVPTGSNGAALVHGVAALDGAGPEHVAFATGKAELAQSKAGFCFVEPGAGVHAPAGMVVIECAMPAVAFAACAGHFYPDNGLAAWSQQTPVDPSAQIGAGVMLAPGVVIGPGAEIGEGTRIGPNTVIGRGVAIGRDCEIGSNVTITHAYIGDRVLIFPGVRIGTPGFGFNSSAKGHAKVPQLGRVIVQDRVEIGSNSTIDRGALGDTVIGEGTKIDNLVQIGHNTHVGRHCIIVSQAGISGSCALGDFVVLGGQVGVADHAHIGDGARIAGKSGVTPGILPGGRDYGGIPARPAQDWRREVAALALLARRKKKTK